MFISLLILTGLSGCGTLHSGGGHNHFASNHTPKKTSANLNSGQCHSSILSYIFSNKPLLVTSNKIESLQAVEDSDKSASLHCRDSLSLNYRNNHLDLSSDSKRYIFTSRIRV